MKNKIIIFFLFLFAFANKNAVSQDIIIKKNNDQLKVKIIEIGTKEIKFRYFDTPDGPIITMAKKEIKTIKLQGANDKVVDIADDPMSISNDAILNKTSVLKYNFFSPLRHHLGFGYEWMQRPGLNWEAGLGIIGPGVGISDAVTNTKPKGVFVRFGPKFLLGSTSDVAVEEGRFAHPLKGRYIKIEAILNTFSRTYSIDTTNYFSGYGSSGNFIQVKDSYQSIALNLIYGRQFIIGNAMTLGYYIGLGYGFESKVTTRPSRAGINFDDFNPNRYSHSYFGDAFPLTTTMGFNIGYILKKPDWLGSKSSRAKNSNEPPSRNSMKGN